MKKILLAMAIATVSATSFAQDTQIKKFVGSVGVELASPLSDLKNGYKFGIGGSAQGEYMASENFGVTLNAGYISYSGKSTTFAGQTLKNKALGQIPVLAGARYYFIKDIYVSGQLGMSFFNQGVGSAFTYAPGIGAKASILDLTLKYMGASKNSYNFSNVSLRVAVSF